MFASYGARRAHAYRLWRNRWRFVLALGWTYVQLLQRLVTRHLATAAVLASQLLGLSCIGVRVPHCRYSSLLNDRGRLVRPLMLGALLGFPQGIASALPGILVSAVPISIAGWGVRESAMVTASPNAGLGNSNGLSCRCFRGRKFVVGVLGDFIWVASSADHVRFRTLHGESAI